MNKELEPYKLGGERYIFLKILYGHDGVNQEELSNLLNIDKATTARAIKKLEKDGYVIKKVLPENRREYKIYLTKKAIDIKPIIDDVLYSWTHILLQKISEEEREQVQQILKKMAHNAAKYIKRPL